MKIYDMKESDQYKKNGYYIVPGVVVPGRMIREARARIDTILKGHYETGKRPWRNWNIGDSKKVQKMDQVHLVDKTIFKLVTHQAIGEWAQRITGAKLIQVWATQLFYKPPGGGVLGNVGWHTDQQYWKFWRGDVFSAWLALTDITIENGPITFVDGSHNWCTNEGDAYAQDLIGVRDKMASDIPHGNAWRETPVAIPAGGMSFHHRKTWHGSRENLSGEPRCNIVINLRTEKSQPIPEQEDYGYCRHLHDPEICPVIYDAAESNTSKEEQLATVQW